jgi:hypothetical protein
MVFSGTILVCTYGISPQFGVLFVCNKPNIHIQITAPRPPIHQRKYLSHADCRPDRWFGRNRAHIPARPDILVWTRPSARV